MAATTLVADTKTQWSNVPVYPGPVVLADVKAENRDVETAWYEFQFDGAGSSSGVACIQIYKVQQDAWDLVRELHVPIFGGRLLYPANDTVTAGSRLVVMASHHHHLNSWGSVRFLDSPSD